MNAVILPFKRQSQHVVSTAHLPALRATLLDTIAQVLMDDYADSPWEVIHEAICAAGEALSDGGSFLDAVEASENIILAHHVAHGNRPMAEAITSQRRQRQDAFFHLAALIIDDRLKDQTWNKHYALARARRIIEGGGTVGSALHHALGDELGGAA